MRDTTSPQAVWQEKLQQDSPIKTHYLANPANFWWHNPTNYDSLRLSRNAFLAIKNTIKFYKFTLDNPILPRMYVQLERVFTEPYFIQNHNTIHLVSDRDAMMLSLHANNLQQYLDNQTNSG